MATFIKPVRVTVDEGGGWLGAVLAVIGLAVVISSAAVLIEDVLNAILITMVALVLVGTGTLAIILRRNGLRAPLPPPSRRALVPVPPARPATAISGPRLSIEHRRLIAGAVEAVAEEKR